jgi:hypothetical protein
MSSRGNPLGTKELPSGGTNGQHLVKDTAEPTGNKWDDQAATHSHSNKSILDGDTASYTTEEQTNLANQSNTNTGDQDLSGLAEKSNVLELNNTDPFTPDADYEPATKKYVDDADDLSTKNADSSLSGNSYFKNDSNFATPDASKVASELAIKVYVDQNIAGVPAKENAHVATTTYLDNVGVGTWTRAGAKATKTLTAGSVGILSIDGHAVELGDRVYIKNEDGSSTNLTDIDQGIYDVTVEGTAGVVTELTRSDDFNGVPSSEVKNGVYAYVTLGTENGNTGWRVLADGDVDVDVDSMVITQFQGLPGNHAPNHTDGTDDIQNATASQKGLATAAQITKLDDIQALAEVNNISNANATDLTDGGDSTLHIHNSDRARVNHSGTQPASSISDFDTEVSNNSSVAANTAKDSNENHSGDVTGSTALTIANDAVTLAKMADMATASLLGRNTAAIGDPEVLPAATVRTLLNVENGANNYSHPANHPPSIITQDLNNRFVTDSEKSTWNGKEDALGFTPENLANKNQSGGYPGLISGKISSSQIPAIAISEVFPVADITARDALVIGSGDGEIQEGDVAIVTDASADSNIISGPGGYIYSGSVWLLFKSGDDILSVAGKTGIVTLDTDDITEAAKLFYTESRVNANTNVAASAVHKTSDGSDHTFIDQDVTSGSSPTFSGSNISGIPASSVSIATGSGSPTINQIQEYLNNTGSSGFFLGGELSDGGAGTLNVAAGSGFIRTTNDDHAELQSFKWSESLGIAVTNNTTQYVYVDDSGVISLSTDEFLETPDKIQIGVVTDEGGSIESIFSLGVRLQESIGQAGRFIRRVHGISRDKRRGGLIFGQSGDANRDVSMTSGILWWGRTEYPISVLNTSGVDTFQTYSASGQENAVASQWPNEQYDNAGTLTTLANNRWANLFFFIEPTGKIFMVYGRSQFNSEGLADEEGVPSASLPTKISDVSILSARFTFQKSSNTASIASAFDQLFANAGVFDHGDLAGLANDDHPKSKLLDGRLSDITELNADTYTLLTTDYLVHVIYTTTGVVTSLTIPSAQIASPREFTIKDGGGNAGVNSITIDTEGSETINGAATFVLSTNYEAITLYSYNGNLYSR